MPDARRRKRNLADPSLDVGAVDLLEIELSEPRVDVLSCGPCHLFPPFLALVLESRKVGRLRVRAQGVRLGLVLRRVRVEIELGV